MPASNSRRFALRYRGHTWRMPLPGAGVVARLAFAVPGDLTTPTGGYRYNWRIIQELRRLGWQVEVLDLPSGPPCSSAAPRATALPRRSASPAGCPSASGRRACGAAREGRGLRRRAWASALLRQPPAWGARLDAR